MLHPPGEHWVITEPSLVAAGNCDRKKTTGFRCSVSSAQRTQHCSVLSSHMPAANSDKKKEHLLLTRGPHRYRGTDVTSGLAAAVGRAAGLQGKSDWPLSCHHQQMTVATVLPSSAAVRTQWGNEKARQRKAEPDARSVLQNLKVNHYFLLFYPK